MLDPASLSSVSLLTVTGLAAFEMKGDSEKGEAPAPPSAPNAAGAAALGDPQKLPPPTVAQINSDRITQVRHNL